MGHDPVILVVRLLGIAQHETTLVDVRRVNDLHAVFVELLQLLQRQHYPRRR